MNWPKLPNRKPFLEKGYTSVQMRDYAEKCVKQALMEHGLHDDKHIDELEQHEIKVVEPQKWVKYVEKVLIEQCHQSPRMALYLSRHFEKMVPSRQWKSITNDEVISLIPKRELDLSALILFGKRVNDFLMNRNTWN